MNYESILAALKPEAKPKALNVTAEWLTRVAQFMANRGYRHNADSLKALEAYLAGYDILLTGSFGVGKTFFFDCLSTATAPIVRLNMNEAHLWKYDDLADFLRDNRGNDMVIDDIRGDIGKDYGKAYDPLIVILENRFEVRARTHYTTNLTNEELIERLDHRDVDRLYTAKPFVIRREESLRSPLPNSFYVSQLKNN